MWGQIRGSSSMYKRMSSRDSMKPVDMEENSGNSIYCSGY